MDDPIAILVLCIAAVMCVAIPSCSVKDYYSERNVVEAMKAGATAQEARCAIYGSSSTDHGVCSVIAARQK